MISVIIPLYNKEKQIVNTLQTVLHQTYKDFEIVIVNDGSTDNSIAEVNKIKDSRIRIINQKNAGVSAARNRGIEEAKYDLIAFLDADDEWKPEYLETQYNLYLKYPKCSVFAVNYEFRNLKCEVSSTIIKRIPFNSVDGILTNYFEIASISNPPLWTSAVMVKKSTMELVGGFPIGITNGEDLITWAKLAVRYQIAYSRRTMAVYVLREAHDVGAKPKNIPQGNDVGDMLEKLIPMVSHDTLKELKLYISKWYTIRSNIFLRGEEYINAYINIMRGLKYNFLNFKLYLYLLILIIPLKDKNKIFFILKKWKNRK